MLSKPNCCLILSKTNDIELAESASFCLLGLVFTPKLLGNLLPHLGWCFTIVLPSLDSLEEAGQLNCSCIVIKSAASFLKKSCGKPQLVFTSVTMGNVPRN